MCFANETGSCSTRTRIQNRRAPGFSPPFRLQVVADGYIDGSVGSLDVEVDVLETKYTIPILGVSVESIQSILRSINQTGGTDSLAASIDPIYVENAWIRMHRSKVVFGFSIFLAVAACATASFCLIRLIQFYRATGSVTFNAPQVALILEMICCLISFIHWSTDPTCVFRISAP
jgi:hypothetical protein